MKTSPIYPVFLTAAVVILVGCTTIETPCIHCRTRNRIENDNKAASPVAGKDWRVPDVGMEFVWVKTMNFWVGKYEVTNGEYRQKNPEHDSRKFARYSLNGDCQPVVYVNFAEARDFAEWLTAREKKAGRLPKGMKYRLPTKGEWLVFAQCGDNREFYWGNEHPPKYGNYADKAAKKVLGSLGVMEDYYDGFPATCPVEKSGRSDWGLYGVGGNVREICTNKPGGPFGAWQDACWGVCGKDIGRCTLGGWARWAAEYRDQYTGFRLVLSP